MFGWIEKIRTTGLNRRRFEPRGAETAGDAAEDAVFEQLERIVAARGKSDTWRIWSGVRIRDKGWRSEIDLVISTDDRLILLELKNWSGQLDMNGKKLVQIRRHHGGIIEHGDLMKVMRQREAAVRAWLKKHRCAVPPIERCVIFYNPRLQMTPAVFEYFGREVSSASEWVSQFARDAKKDAHTRALPDEAREKLHRTIEQLPTWDTATLYGGRMIRGDIRSGEASVTLKDGVALRLHNRRKIAAMDVNVVRGYVRALFGEPRVLTVVLHLRDGRTVNAQVPVDTHMRIHAAGQRAVESMPLRHLTHIRFGSA